MSKRNDVVVMTIDDVIAFYGSETFKGRLLKVQSEYGLLKSIIGTKLTDMNNQVFRDLVPIVNRIDSNLYVLRHVDEVGTADTPFVKPLLKTVENELEKILLLLNVGKPIEYQSDGAKVYHI